MHYCSALWFKVNTRHYPAFAVKTLKEVKYHLRFSTAWMERLSLGTAEAHEKIQHGLNQLWRFTEELFVLTADEKQLVESGVIPESEALKNQWLDTIQSELNRFQLTLPETGAYRSGAKQGLHTEHLGYVLAELQYVQRSVSKYELVIQQHHRE